MRRSVAVRTGPSLSPLRRYVVLCHVFALACFHVLVILLLKWNLCVLSPEMADFTLVEHLRTGHSRSRSRHHCYPSQQLVRECKKKNALPCPNSRRGKSFSSAQACSTKDCFSLLLESTTVQSQTDGIYLIYNLSLLSGLGQCNPAGGICRGTPG